MQTFDEAFARVKELVAIFKENEGFYTSSGYNEADARKDFIDKFWIALGWDVNHETQTDPYKQEVKVERGVATSEWRKRADYAFLAANFRDTRFFVEAKKPHAGIDNPLFYFQTIRYGWNSHVPISVLTDFEELRVLDCRYKPEIKTALGHAILKYHYEDYADKEKFRTIYYLFSREAVTNGSIQEFAKGLPKLARKRAARGVSADEHQSIDGSFLQELDDFREELARAYKRKNPELDGAELTEVTQRTLDRLVFMRFLEDKLIESDSLIEDLHKRGKSWDNFVATSRRLDRIYNGIIFKEHSLLDGDKFNADERVFDKISQSLSHRESPYDFNAIPIHILGSIYERFLGKVIVATDKRARVEEKPEVRKAGGVYYTPEYIVRYIVDNTVGKLIEGKTPAEIQEMRFADIACGSGSFLLGVYDTLLRHHTAHYNRTKKTRTEGIKAGCIQKPDGALQLSLLQKRQILLNNIYGVDIDPQAVEVAQLSLYLKLLEDETIASTHQQALKEALLPSLSKNIVCGNSLIGWDITEGKLFDTADERGLNPMNFEDTFSEVMKRGGFDAIVGNPPYIRMEVFKNIKNYLTKNYASHDERSDLYAYFIERGNELIKPGGRYGVIVSNKFLRANYGAPLRDLLKQKTRVQRIVDFAGLPVFKGATVRTVILLTSQDGGAHKPLIYSPPIPPAIFATVEAGLLSVEKAITGLEYKIDPASLSQPVWNFMKRDKDDLFGKLKERGLKLGDYCNGQICMGVKSGLTEAFVIDAAKRAEIIGKNPEAQQIIKPFLNGRDVRRYYIDYKNMFLIYTYHGVRIKNFPAIEAHLRPFKQRLEKRATKQAWYELQQPQLAFAPLMDAEKIIFPDIATTPRFAPDTTGCYGSNTTYFIPRRDPYLLALLNSSVGRFYFSVVCAGLEGKTEIYLRFFGQYLEGFPVHTINSSDDKDRERHDRVVQLVDQMLEAKTQLASVRTERDKTFYESKCATLDRQIDSLVYELYDLTPEEITIVEEDAR